MKQFCIIMVGLLLLGITAQARHKKHKNKKATKSGVVAAMVQYTGCFGKCTEYSIELNQTGVVTYTGIKYAKDSGTYQKKITQSEAARILHLFEVYRVDTCPNRFPNRIPDIQVMFFNVKYTDSTKRINNATFGPGYFKELAAELQQIGQKTGDGWEKVGKQ